MKAKMFRIFGVSNSGWASLVLSFSLLILSLLQSLFSASDSLAQVNSTIPPTKIVGSVSNNIQGTKKIVILTFDDAWKSQITNAKPILDKYGFKGTFFIVCNYVGKDSSRMDWEDVTALKNDYQDIESHTMNHKALNKMPTKQLEYEVGQSKQCLLDHGINNPAIFATPYNEGWNNETVIRTIAKYYDLARNGNAEPMFLHCDKWNVFQHDCRTFYDNGTLTYANRYSIRSWSHNFYDNKYSHNKSRIFDEFVKVINNQVKYNKALDRGETDRNTTRMTTVAAVPILEYHNIDNSNTSYATGIDLFEAEMKYLGDNDITVLPMSALKFDSSSNYLYIK
jgi:peptidoglycan/xylan/chitin deacetylase (PgdA/CDA1 family)